MAWCTAPSQNQVQYWTSSITPYDVTGSQWVNHKKHNKARTLLTHWGRVMHICVSKLTIIGSDNGLSPGRHQAIIWTNAGILLIGSLGTNLSEILIKILTFSFKKMQLKISSAKWRPFSLGLNVLVFFWVSCTRFEHGDLSLLWISTLDKTLLSLSLLLLSSLLSLFLLSLSL